MYAPYVIICFIENLFLSIFKLSALSVYVHLAHFRVLISFDLGLKKITPDPLNGRLGHRISKCFKMNLRWKKRVLFFHYSFLSEYVYGKCIVKKAIEFLHCICLHRQHKCGVRLHMCFLILTNDNVCSNVWACIFPCMIRLRVRSPNEATLILITMARMERGVKKLPTSNIIHWSGDIAKLWLDLCQIVLQTLLYYSFISV